MKEIADKLMDLDTEEQSLAFCYLIGCFETAIDLDMISQEKVIDIFDRTLKRSRREVRNG